MPKHSSITRKIFALIAIPAVFEIAIVLLIAFANQQLTAAINLENNTRRMLYKSFRLTTIVRSAWTSLLTNSNHLNEDTFPDDRYIQATLLLPQLIKELEEYTDSPNAFSKSAALRRQSLDDLKHLHAAIKNGDQLLVQKYTSQFERGSYQHVQATFMDCVALQEAHNQRLVIAEKQLVESQKALTYVIWWGLFGNIAICAGMALYARSTTLKRLRLLSNNIRLFGEGKPLPALDLGNDELGDIDRVFHENAQALFAATQTERVAFDHCPELVCLLDENGKVIQSNTALQHSGLLPPDKANAIQFADLVTGCDPSNLTRCMNDARQQEGHQLLESATRNETGEIWHQWAIQWLPSENSYFCIGSDLTEQKEAEHMKSQLRHMVTHDLKTPLSSIRATYDLVRDGPYGTLSDHAAEQVNEINEQIDSVLLLIRDLLDIDKFEAGKMELELTEVDLRLVLEEVIGELPAHLQTALDCRVGHGPSVRADEQLLKRVLAYVCQSAIDGTADKQVRISADFNGQTVQLKFVRPPAIAVPTHCPLADDHSYGREAILRPLCHWIVRAHGGILDDENTENADRAFVLSLPGYTH